jgi:hypothetical protein
VDVFELRDRLIGEFARRTRGFVEIRERRIRRQGEAAPVQGTLLPEPRIALVPGRPAERVVAGP